MKIQSLYPVAFALLLVACQSPVNTPETPTEDILKEDNGSEAMHPVSVPLVGQTESFGTVAVPPGNQIAFYPHTPAIIADLYVLAGQVVKKGDALYRLESMQLIEMQHDYQNALARLSVARADYERQQTLRTSQSISDKSYEQAEEAFSSAKSQVLSLEKMLLLNGIDTESVKAGQVHASVTVRSPAAGFVTSVAAIRGERVEGNKPILTLTDASQQYLDVQMQARLATRIQVGDSLQFRTMGNEQWLRGVVLRVGSTINPQNNTLNIHVAPAPLSNLIIGERVLVRFGG